VLKYQSLTISSILYAVVFSALLSAGLNAAMAGISIDTTNSTITVKPSTDNSIHDDDTIQAALDYIISTATIIRTPTTSTFKCKYRLCLSPGIFIIHKPITMPFDSNNTVVGLSISGASSGSVYNDVAGNQSTVIKCSNDFAGYEMLSLSYAFYSGTMENIQFIGMSDADTVDGLALDHSNCFRIENCTFSNCWAGAHLTWASIPTFQNCQFTKSRIGMQMNYAGDFTMINCYFNTNKFETSIASDWYDGCGLVLINSGNCSIIGGKFEWNGKGIFIQNSQGINIIGSNFDYNTYCHIYLFQESFPKPPSTVNPAAYNIEGINIVGNRFLGTNVKGGLSAHIYADVLTDGDLTLSGNTFVRSGKKAAAYDYDEPIDEPKYLTGPTTFMCLRHSGQSAASGNFTVTMKGNTLQNCAKENAYDLCSFGGGITINTSDISNMKNCLLSGSGINNISLINQVDRLSIENPNDAVLPIYSKSTSGKAGMQLLNSNLSYQLLLDGTDANKLKFQRNVGNPSTVLTLDQSGQVGIGTASPNSALDVNGCVRSSTASVTGSLTAANTTITGLTSTGNLSIGGGASITKYLTATKLWDPPSLAINANTTTTLPVAGAAIGDPVTVGLTSVAVGGIGIYGVVTAASTVTVTLINNTTGVKNLSSGTLRVGVWKH
jgi:hypothetical protein